MPCHKGQERSGLVLKSLLARRPACFETPPPSPLASAPQHEGFLCATKNLPHPEEPGRASARPGISKDAHCCCSTRKLPLTPCGPAGPAGDRKRVGSGKRGSVRVDLGGGRFIKKKK